MKYIELFAGCGGLSLGLESVGFELLFANELSPMASETYAFNLLHEDLSAPDITKAKKVLWITSNFTKKEIAKRLRENPQTFPKYDKGRSDLSTDPENLDGCLLVGSIIELNRFLEQNVAVAERIRKQNIDLVSGGPPCQSFSLAGLRQVDNQRNSLPMDFAKFVSLTKPKVALLENVSGILRAFKVNGGKYFAWYEVARAFASVEYYPVCLHVNAKNVGAAQNRPRFILLALRKDVFGAIQNQVEDSEVAHIFAQTQHFFDKEKSGAQTIPFQDLGYLDIEKNRSTFLKDPFSSLLRIESEKDFYSVEDAIDDLNEYSRSSSKYASMLIDAFPNKTYTHDVKTIANHEKRGNSDKVKMRFMLYQHLSDLKLKSSSEPLQGVEKNVIQFLQDPEGSALSDSSITFLLKRKFLSKDGRSLIEFSSAEALLDYLKHLSTKKQTQRALLRSSPAPASLSIPDDACHYDKRLQRTLTVREMARFQSFPDWFQFRSKVTTGGKMRRFEVPQYTQVGNAVPPLLGRALGETVKAVLRLAE